MRFLVRARGGERDAFVPVQSEPGCRPDVASEAKLLYVAMTRATERLMVTAHERNAFVERLVA